MDVIPGSIHKSSQDLPDNGDAAGAEGEPNHPTHVCNTAILPLNIQPLYCQLNSIVNAESTSSYWEQKVDKSYENTTLPNKTF
jgi:hypothetical protein